jgi:pimeloyl-ACP methyl ester carboxylesterase
MPDDQRTGIYYEVHGSGTPLFMGPPLVASGEILDPPYLDGYLDRLTDRYRVLVFDPPGKGKSASKPAAEFTANRVCNDLLSVADAAGFERFAWWGFSWGGVVGLQLAWRTDRLSALVCGGWPPLGAEYAKLLRLCRALVANPPLDGPHAGFDAAPFVTLYESLQNWPEAEAVRRIACPRMTYVGCDDIGVGAVEVHLGASIRDRRLELEAMGWRVVEIPGRDHSVYTDPATVVPLVRDFLDAAV